MPNVFTALAPILFSAAQEVAAESTGSLDAISMSFDDKRVAKNDVVKVPVASGGTPVDFIPGNVTPQGDSDEAADVEVKVTASKKRSWHLTGEQRRSLENAGTDKEWLRLKLMQEMRSLRNMAEGDCVLAVVEGACRASGIAGTTPFASNLDELIAMRRILKDNGSPHYDPQFICDSAAEANILKLSAVQQAYAAGSDEERRSGIIKPQFGFRIRSSAQIGIHEKGDGSNYAVNATTAMVKGDLQTLLSGASGAGTIKKGDVITFAADTENKYICQNEITASQQLLKVGRPGVMKGIAVSNAITVGESYTPCLAFERGAVVGIMRPPVMPENPTMTQALVSDIRGLTYLLLEIAQYGQITWELHLAWGFKVVNSEFVALLLG
jgi:hypothetical protein